MCVLASDERCDRYNLVRVKQVYIPVLARRFLPAAPLEVLESHLEPNPMPRVAPAVVSVASAPALTFCAAAAAAAVAAVAVDEGGDVGWD